MSALFACTKCMQRYPFEELSSGHQLCKDCRGTVSLIKCTYCRTEFQDCSKEHTTVCQKCESNEKAYGKPTACIYCNIIAAFIGSKCQRCTNSEKKYGSPVTCEQCKQRCAFDRRDDSQKKVDGKLLCWLCTLSYKRALAKAKQNSSSHHSAMSLSKSAHHHSHKRSHSGHSSKHKKKEHGISKKIKLENLKSTNGILPTSSSESRLLDPSMSDHVAALAQLKDQISSLQKQLDQKDAQMCAKDKQFSDVKVQNGILATELKLKIQTMTKQHSDVVDDLQTKVRELQKQITTLTKTKNKISTDSPKRL